MKDRINKLWNSFTNYEKIWFFSVIILTIIVAILFPSTIDDLQINPLIIISLYIADVFTNALCELLISKQSKWNFIVSLLVEIIEITTCIVIGARFATVAITLFFWIPIDIISFINWHKHVDDNDDNLTEVRQLKGWVKILIIIGIIIWTIGVGELLLTIDVDSLLEAGSLEEKIVCYLDAMSSAVAVCNGVFIFLRYKEQWFAWYINTFLEIVINILLGQWILLVLKAAYLSNTTYGYIKWTKYIKNKDND